MRQLQYRFLYDALFEAYTSRHTRLSLTAFDRFFPHDVNPYDTSEKIDVEFEVNEICNLSLVLSCKSYFPARYKCETFFVCVCLIHRVLFCGICLRILLPASGF